MLLQVVDKSGYIASKLVISCILVCDGLCGQRGLNMLHSSLCEIALFA